ncbi:MAG TPA: CsbD family protein [Candidatus Dormibacteraeota bacterium]|nr:CsbD family protein [Candidatus Dormibacteraeota bacterium]
MPGREDEAKGTIKKTVGKAVGNKKLINEGRTQKASGTAKRKVDDAKQSIKGAVKGVKKSAGRSSRA